MDATEGSWDPLSPYRRDKTAAAHRGWLLATRIMLWSFAVVLGVQLLRLQPGITARSFGVLLATIGSLRLGLIAWQAWRAFLTLRRQFLGVCIQCGYEISGMPVWVCPECGAEPFGDVREKAESKQDWKLRADEWSALNSGPLEPGTDDPPSTLVDLLQRMVDAVERVRKRLVRASVALREGDVEYAVVGANAVAAWVATVDPSAVRNTQDVEVMIRRADFVAAKLALEGAGFIHRPVEDSHVFLDGASAGPRDAVQVSFSGELARAGDALANPDVGESVKIDTLRVIDLNALVRLKLAAWRIEDRVHIRDLIDVGLVDPSWVAKLPAALGARLQQLIDTPEG